ncbi:MAG: hypothetical protein Tsb005_01180 [Gammaproteobacteria bacterium]
MLESMKIKSLQNKAAELRRERQSSQVSDAKRKKEITIYFQLAKIYEKLRFDKKQLNAEIYMMESYRAAANLGSAEAQYILSDLLIKKGRFWQHLNSTIWADKIHQKYAHDMYSEAFAYLKLAEDQDYPLAIRLHGLTYINGWGVEVDQDRGFKLVVDSIDKEQAWDRATQIFEEIGLNKPEFFSSIMSVKQNQNKT